MKAKNSSGAGRAVILAAFVTTLMAATVSHAQLEGEILKKGQRTWLRGRITWKAGSKSYAIFDPRTSATYPVPLQDVQAVRTAKPAGLDAAISQVNSGNPDAAIPTLKSIVDRYLMMQYDVPAAEALAKAYLANKDPRSAKDVCKMVLDDKPAEWVTSDLVMIYWDALLGSGDVGILNNELKKAIKTGSRPVVAAAYIVRGDIDMERNDPKGALERGYLRVVVLFREVKELRAEALFKAYNAFDKLGRSGDKDRMRKMLLDEYPQSSYADKLR